MLFNVKWETFQLFYLRELIYKQYIILEKGNIGIGLWKNVSIVDWKQVYKSMHSRYRILLSINICVTNDHDMLRMS